MPNFALILSYLINYLFISHGPLMVLLSIKKERSSPELNPSKPNPEKTNPVFRTELETAYLNLINLYAVVTCMPFWNGIYPKPIKPAGNA